MDNILEVKNLTKDFGKFKLDNVSFNLPMGFIMGFIGPNGAGKTTTIKSILGSLRMDSGSIQIFGEDLKSAGQELKERMGVVMDEPFLVEEWSLEEIESILRPFYRSWNKERYYAYLDQFSLDKKKKLSELSKGMKTKLMIAIALCHDAKLLILDEPTSGLDPVARDELMDLLQEYISDENRGVLLSSHITSDLERVADFITFIKDGKILFTGEKDELLDMYLLIKGGPQDLNDDVRRVSIGLKTHETGFNALILKKDRAVLSGGVLVERASIEDIMIHIYRGEQ